MWTEAWVFWTCALYSPPPYAPAEFATVVSEQGERRSSAAASAAESACICRCRLCTNQLPTSRTRAMISTRTGRKRTNTTSVAPRSSRARAHPRPLQRTGDLRQVDIDDSADGSEDADRDDGDERDDRRVFEERLAVACQDGGPEPARAPDRSGRPRRSAGGLEKLHLFGGPHGSLHDRPGRARVERAGERVDHVVLPGVDDREEDGSQLRRLRDEQPARQAEAQDGEQSDHRQCHV